MNIGGLVSGTDGLCIYSLRVINVGYQICTDISGGRNCILRRRSACGGTLAIRYRQEPGTGNKSKTPYDLCHIYTLLQSSLTSHALFSTGVGYAIAPLNERGRSSHVDRAY